MMTKLLAKKIKYVTNPKYIGTWSPLTFLLGFVTRIAWFTLSCIKIIKFDWRLPRWFMRIHVVVTLSKSFISGTHALILYSPCSSRYCYVATSETLLIVCSQHSQFSKIYRLCCYEDMWSSINFLMMSFPEGSKTMRVWVVCAAARGQGHSVCTR